MQRIILLGFMGSGKSTLGKQLAGIMAIPFLDSDILIEKKSALTINEIFATRGEQAFREMEVEVITELFEVTEFVLAVGGGLPAIPGMMERLNELGTTIFLNVSMEELLRRLLTDRSNRPLLKDKNEWDLKNQIGRLRASRESVYKKAQICIENDSITAEQLVEILSQKN
jgi:shikimate kinase